jgi:hypothetical protein
MKNVLIVICVLLSFLQSDAQTKPVKDLFQTDSVVTYIGIINKFKINPHENIKQVGKTKGVDVIIEKGLVEIRPYYKGNFPVEFKTSSGIKKILLISKVMTPDKKN